MHSSCKPCFLSRSATLRPFLHSMICLFSLLFMTSLHHPFVSPIIILGFSSSVTYSFPYIRTIVSFRLSTLYPHRWMGHHALPYGRSRLVLFVCQFRIGYTCSLRPLPPSIKDLLSLSSARDCNSRPWPGSAPDPLASPAWSILAASPSILYGPRGYRVE